MKFWLSFTDGISKCCAVIYCKLTDLLSDHIWVVIEYHCHPKAAISKTLVSGNSAADITGPNNGDIPYPVYFQDLVQVLT